MTDRTKQLIKNGGYKPFSKEHVWYIPSKDELMVTRLGPEYVGVSPYGSMITCIYIGEL
jgi:hypothetical protein